MFLAVYGRLPVFCGIAPLGAHSSTSSAAALCITGVAEERGDWSNGQVVSPKAELDMGEQLQATDKDPVVRASAFSLRHTRKIHYHSLYISK